MTASRPVGYTPAVFAPSARTVRIACGVVGVVAALVAADGLDRRPADATLAPPLRHAERLDRATRDTLRLATWNIHRGRPLDGPEDLAATLADLASVAPDLAALQEVGGSPALADDPADQAAELADGLGLASLFVGTERRWWHEHLGNALLTNVPPGEVHRVPLPGTQGKKYRQAALTTVPLGGGTVRVLSVHLDHRVDRERQLAAVLDLFLALERPAVLLGDLNTWRDREPLGRSAGPRRTGRRRRRGPPRRRGRGPHPHPRAGRARRRHGAQRRVRPRVMVGRRAAGGLAGGRSEICAFFGRTLRLRFRGDSGMPARSRTPRNRKRRSDAQILYGLSVARPKTEGEQPACVPATRSRRCASTTTSAGSGGTN